MQYIYLFTDKGSRTAIILLVLAVLSGIYFTVCAVRSISDRKRLKAELSALEGKEAKKKGKKSKKKARPGKAGETGDISAETGPDTVSESTISEDIPAVPADTGTGKEPAGTGDNEKETEKPEEKEGNER